MAAYALKLGLDKKIKSNREIGFKSNSAKCRVLRYFSTWIFIGNGEEVVCCGFCLEFGDRTLRKAKSLLISQEALNTVGAESRNRTGTPCGAGF
jgi:hypothetical protein